MPCVGLDPDAWQGVRTAALGSPAGAKKAGGCGAQATGRAIVSWLGRWLHLRSAPEVQQRLSRDYF